MTFYLSHSHDRYKVYGSLVVPMTQWYVPWCSAPSPMNTSSAIWPLYVHGWSCNKTEWKSNLQIQHQNWLKTRNNLVLCITIIEICSKNSELGSQNGNSNGFNSDKYFPMTTSAVYANKRVFLLLFYIH